MGPVKIGMTLTEAQKAMPGARFVRSTDGEGRPLVSVIPKKMKQELFVLFADESDDAITGNKKISFIETFNQHCKTAQGVYPGMPLPLVEKRLGKITEIMTSEIESREFVTFAGQNGRSLYRSNYSGLYKAGSARTLQYGVGAKIWSIAISKGAA